MLAAERQRHDPARLGHARTASGSSARIASSSAGATTSLSASTTRAPRASACSATTSIAARLELDEVRVGVDARRAPRASRSRRARLRDTCTTSASRWSVGAGPVGEDGDAALERLGRAQPEREVLARLEHEVADERAVGIEPGEIVRDEDARRGRDRRDRRSAAVEDDDVGLERRGEPSALEDVRGERRAGHAASRATAADRRHSSERRGLEMSRTPRAVPSARARRDRRASAASRSARAPPARRAPSRRRRPCGRARAAARRGRRRPSSRRACRCR